MVSANPTPTARCACYAGRVTRNSKPREDLKAVSECVRCDRIGEQMKQLLTVLLMIVAWALVILGIRRPGAASTASGSKRC